MWWRPLVLLALLVAIACQTESEDCALIDASCAPYASLFYTTRTSGSPFFVAVSMTGLTATSRNATNWSLAPTGTGLSLQRLAAGSGYFVASGNNTVIAYSRDAINWSQSPALTTGQVRGGGHYNGMLVGAGEDNASTAAFFTSVDGVTWNTFSVVAGLYETMATGNGRVVGCGGDSTITCGYTADGTNWAESTPAGITHLKSSAFLGGLFYFASLATGGKYATTRDGVDWAVHSIPGASTATFFGVAASGTVLVFGDFSGGVHVIENGNYTKVSLPSSILGVAYAGGTFVATGTSGQLFVSGDAYRWDTYVVGSDQWSGVAADFR